MLSRFFKLCLYKDFNVHSYNFIISLIKLVISNLNIIPGFSFKGSIKDFSKN